MLPLKVKLENFMCFSKMEIDFRSFKNVCIFGSNGSGKTTILDAISWAIWNKARANTDKLLRIGSQRMSVELEFSESGNLYKIVKKFHKGSTKKESILATVTLDFFEFDKKNNSWVAISDVTAELTQHKILNILKIDYNLYSNSIYIQQGHLDTFITKPPGERKQFLSDVIGLQEYKNLQDLAKQKVSELEHKASGIKQNLNDIEAKQFSLKQYKDQKEQLLLDISLIQEKLSNILSKKKGVDSSQVDYSILVEQKKIYDDIKLKYEHDIIELNTNLKNLEESIKHFKAISILEKSITQQYNQYTDLKSKIKRLDAKELEYHQLKDRLVEQGSRQIISRFASEQEYKKISQALEDKLQQVDHYRRITAKTEAIQKLYSEFLDFKEEIKEIDKAKSDLAYLEINIVKLQSVIESKKDSYKFKLDNIESKIAEIINNVSHKPELMESIDFIETELKNYDKYDAELEKIRELGIEHREKIMEKNNQNSLLEIELENLKTKINEYQVSNNKLAGKEQKDNVIVSEDIMRKMEFEIDNLMSKIETNNADISLAEDEIKFCRISYKEYKKHLAKRSMLIFQLAELKSELKTIELEEKKLSQLEENKKEIKQIIEKPEFLADEYDQLKHLTNKKDALVNKIDSYKKIKYRLDELSYIENEHKELMNAKGLLSVLESELPYYTMSKRTLEKELHATVKEKKDRLTDDIYIQIQNLNYDINEHMKLREKLLASQQIEYDYLTLQYSHKQLPILEKNYNQICKSILNYQNDLEEINLKIQSAQFKMDEILYENNKRNYSLEEYEQTSNQLVQCNCDIAILNDRIASIENEIVQIKDKKKELDKINSDIIDFLELSESFGEKGLQDVIIENSLPEIESVANKILAGLSSSQMRVSFKSGKTSKLNEYNDKLDIYITDSLGTRNFELYSGGESFIINFAIRIAISKLLAKSRGTDLQTLIVDDGIASQDSYSMKKFSEAVKSISKDFDLVIVVSHLEEFAQYFQSRIELTRQAGTTAIKIAG